MAHKGYDVAAMDDDDDGEGHVEMAPLTTMGGQASRSMVVGWSNSVVGGSCLFGAVLGVALTLSASAVVKVALRSKNSSSKTVDCWRAMVDIRYASNVTSLRDDDIGPMQGLTYGDDVLYESHATGIRNYTLDATELTELKTSPFDLEVLPLIIDQPVSHIGGIAYAKNHSILWFATHDAEDTVGAIMGLETSTFNFTHVLLASNDLTYDWVAIDNDRNVGYTAESDYITSIQRFDPQGFEHRPLELVLPEGPLSAGINYIQSGTINGDLWLIADDLQNTMYRIDVDTGALLSTQAALVGNEIAGLAWVAPLQAFLVGINRAHTHERDETGTIKEMESILMLVNKPEKRPHHHEDDGTQLACYGALRIFDLELPTAAPTAVPTLTAAPTAVPVPAPAPDGA